MYIPVNIEISHLTMAGEEQTDSSGKYAMGGGQTQGSARFWPTILKVIELVSYTFYLKP